METSIASLKLAVEAPCGTCTNAEISLGAPALEDDGTWSCQIRIQGLGKPDGVRKLYGGDSLQALCLAMTFLKEALEHCRKTRKLLFAEGEGEEAEWPFDAYFPKAWQA